MLQFLALNDNPRAGTIRVETITARVSIVIPDSPFVAGEAVGTLPPTTW